MLKSSFPLAACFTRGSVYVSTLLSELVPPSPSRIVSTSPFSVYISVPTLCVFISTIFLDSLHTHSYMIFAFSLSDFTLWGLYFKFSKEDSRSLWYYYHSYIRYLKSISDFSCLKWNTQISISHHLTYIPSLEYPRPVKGNTITPLIQV